MKFLTNRCFVKFHLPSWVNFTKVLRAAFMYVSFAPSFLCLRFRFVLYWHKTVDEKAECRMLMKLNPVLGNLHYAINVFKNETTCWQNDKESMSLEATARSISYTSL